MAYSPGSQEEPQLLQEKCGIVAIYTPNLSSSLPLTIAAAYGVQHRGQHGVGMAMLTKEGITSHKGNGLIRDVFKKHAIEKHNELANWSMLHCRYGTHGGYQNDNIQPCIAETASGEMCAVVHNGEFAGLERVKKKIKGKMPPETSDTAIFTRLLAQNYKGNWEKAITTTLKTVQGAYSLVIGTNEGLYVIRDPHGIRPLILGEIPNGWIIASETTALDKIGANVMRTVKIGEVMRIDEKGPQTVSLTKERPCFCSFEWAYFARPESRFPTNETNGNGEEIDSWLSVYRFRERCGEVLAKEAPIINASFVAGIPDSGLAVSHSYAHALQIPYRQPIIRDHANMNATQRLFMKDEDKTMIKYKVIGKLSLVPDPSIWEDAIVVLGDDSIVRGNVSAQITKAVFDLGAKEVHWILGFPPVRYTCHLGVSIRTNEELTAHICNGDMECIAKEIGATSVNYISPRGFMKARLLHGTVKNTKDPRDLFLQNGGCGGCITGRYPVAKNGKVAKS